MASAASAGLLDSPVVARPGHSPLRPLLHDVPTMISRDDIAILSEGRHESLWRIMASPYMSRRLLLLVRHGDWWYRSKVSNGPVGGTVHAPVDPTDPTVWPPSEIMHVFSRPGASAVWGTESRSYR